MLELALKSFFITSPNGKKTKLHIPDSKIEQPSQSSNDFDVFNAEIGLQKIATCAGKNIK